MRIDISEQLLSLIKGFLSFAPHVSLILGLGLWILVFLPDSSLSTIGLLEFDKDNHATIALLAILFTATGVANCFPSVRNFAIVYISKCITLQSHKSLILEDAQLLSILIILEIRNIRGFEGDIEGLEARGIVEDCSEEGEEPAYRLVRFVYEYYQVKKNTVLRKLFRKFPSIPEGMIERTGWKHIKYAIANYLADNAHALGLNPNVWLEREGELAPIEVDNF